MKSILRAALVVISSLGFAAWADAAVISSESGTAPNTNILASQLTDSSGANPNNDYTDNAGPPGETFTVARIRCSRISRFSAGTVGACPPECTCWSAASIQAPAW